MRRWQIWETVGKHVRIKQKVIRHTPLDKLLDAFINILAGGRGLVETNKNVRADPGLQRAFGRERCAEQSTISDTINASTEENVEQMRQAVTEVYRTYGQGWRHPYQTYLQLLDVDMTGMPAGRKGEGKDGSWLYSVLASTLSDEELLWLARQPKHKQPTSTQVLFAMLYAYDLRSGGVETSIKGSRQGLGLTKRNKKRFAAQEMLVLLAQLAYNLTIWMRNLLANQSPKLRGYGLLRMVRDVFQIDGCVHWDAQGRILAITLNKYDPLTAYFIRGLAPLWTRDEMYPNLGQN
jgi:hypothetical protein